MLTFLMALTFVMITTLALVLVGGEPQQGAAVRQTRRGVRVRVTR